MTTVRLHNVKVSFASAAQFPSDVAGGTSTPTRQFVLDGINLEAREGETLGILGPSGCGKSTLLRAIAGLIPLDEATSLTTITICAMCRPEGAALVSCFRIMRCTRI